MLDSKQLAAHVAVLTHAPVRIYDENSNIVCYISNADNAQDPLDTDKKFQNELLKLGNDDYPVLFVEKDIIIYSIIKGDGETFIIGPCCQNSDTRSAAKYIVAAHYLDASMIYRLSTTVISNLYEASLMIFSHLWDKKLTREEMLRKNYDIDEFNNEIEKNVMEVYDKYRENSLVHNPYSQECREQKSIENGDEEALKSALGEVYIGELGRMAKDETRSVKNIAISVLALATRSAIKGGLLPEMAFSISDAYSLRIEELSNISEIEALLRSAEYQFTSLVHEIKLKKHQNPIVTGAKDYILKHLNQKITLFDLSNALNVNSSYLSDLFSKQEEVTISEFILKEKIESAKRQLIFTDDSYGKIAYNYGFSSQSHFGKTFKKYAKMTPKEFRKLNKISEVN